MKSKRTKIVIADDNKDYLIILYEYLSKFNNFEVVGIANNGLEAIDIITEKNPDIVIMDIIMPKLDGIGVLEKVKSLHFKKEPSFIMLSALGQYHIVQMAISLGAKFFIMKPFNLDDLGARISQIQSFDNVKISNINNSIDDLIQINNDSYSSTDIIIKKMLNEIGIPSHLKGYNYLFHAIKLVLNDISAINSITKIIYTNIAKDFNTTPTRVERTIRNSIEKAWTNKKAEFSDSNFSTVINKKMPRPTNLEFITLIVDRVLKYYQHN